jgi:hypothetical protein
MTIIGVEHGCIPDGPRAEASAGSVGSPFVIWNSQNHGVCFLLGLPESVAGKGGNAGKGQALPRWRKG